MASGTWSNNSDQKEVDFNPVDGQYVRLLAKSEVNGNNWASAAEINILVEGNITSADKLISLPASFSLSQNYPNPFNPTTTISFAVPYVETEHTVSLHVTLKVFDLLGREVATLVNEEKAPGNYKVAFDASHPEQGRSMTSGIYFYRLTAGDFVEIKKMLLLK